MKTTRTLWTLFVALSGASALAQNGVVDLTKLHNYANQPRPAYITRDNTPSNNAITDAGATLGRILFYDKRLSRNSTVSCSSCHEQSRGFGDDATASLGINGSTGRHSMRLINSRFSNESKFFWDERAASLEIQTTQPIQDHVEMGFSGISGDPAFADLVARLTTIPEYRVLFAMTFGNATITETRVQQSLAQFVRSIQSFDSKYDIGRAQANDNQPFPNFTTAENAGKVLFINTPGPGGGAGCAGCHAPPEFAIDPNSRNNGTTGVIAVGTGTDLTNTRSPSLRDAVGPSGQSNGGLMHDASKSTLADVINHYNAIPGDNANLDNRLRRPGGGVQNLNLTQTQKDNLAAFLRTLTGANIYTDQKWSTPFNAQGDLELIILPASASTLTKNSNGTVTIRCSAAEGLTYRFESSTDLSQWNLITTVTTDATGLIDRTVPMPYLNQFFRFTYIP
ncbi:MAG TPA: cytochrome-c peroxidase [Verrucomicrobiales bacterium]|nr:MAG: hypothetical protein B9S37_11345 [Verrucomicrobiae bacterium Tous-C3TDCM]PAZ06940.1 MAG: hypothetical protein CAK88_02200 [Verrucomicrobiae bacterium AMD-G2]HBE23401.1 cytochrome-c peroxidase [Verrucomicrobiales bacterium]